MYVKNIGMANVYMIKALTIAIRHSAARRQFGPENENGQEVPVLEYQSQVCYSPSVEHYIFINFSIVFFSNTALCLIWQLLT